MANVFISHRTADMTEATRLAQDIVEAGHNVFLDAWDIGIGDSIVAKMNAGLEGATYLVMCYSDAGVMSLWMSREWMAMLARQLNGLNVKILPVRLTGGRPPAILEDIKYADLTKDWMGGMNELLKAIR